MSLFFELIQVSVGRRDGVSRVPSPEEWAGLMDESRRQTLTGVLFGGIERLPAHQRPPRKLLLQWYAQAGRIRAVNLCLNMEVVRIMALVRAEGMEAVLLKGQGVATYYPEPLWRIPGDIDLWMRECRSRVVDYARRLSGKTPPTTFLHTSLHLSEKVETEAHFRPSFRYNPWADRRMNRLFSYLYGQGEFTDVCLSGGSEEKVRVPSPVFNRLFLLAHIYRHFFDEGVGLRQMMDYFFCLRQSFTAEENRVSVCWMRRMGLLRFSRAVVYVLQEVFGLEDEFCFVPPDEREGRFLLDEIMLAGNFGKYDRRYRRASGREGVWRRFLRKSRRNFHLAVHYPGEVIWDVPFRVCHYLWRRMNGFI